MNMLQEITALLNLSEWNEVPMSHEKRLDIYKIANRMRSAYLIEKQEHEDTRQKLIEAKKELSTLKRNAK
jgi:hypothetical protein